MKYKIYDTPISMNLGIEDLKKIFREKGVIQIFCKKLAPNDNSKNQPYLASHISELSFLPTGDMTQEPSTSLKTKDPKRQIRYKAPLPLSWIDEVGNEYVAPGAQVIYYPQYPEVRLSGFLKGCRADLSEWMQPTKKGRSEGRTLFFGIHSDGRILGWLSPPDSQISSEVHDTPLIDVTSVFSELVDSKRPQTSKAMLVEELKRIHSLGSISSKRLDKFGNEKSYKAANGGGYTLEAELGVIPNGIAEPDYHGWEVKQFAVSKFGLSASKPQTLMTPQPDGGVYFEEGIVSFIKKYGYADATQADRYNFNGRHFYGKKLEKTGLTLFVDGFDAETGKISKSDGCMGLVDGKGNIAASWSFAKLIGHWKKKHNKAVYIPSIKSSVAGIPSYHYGNIVRFYEGTTFEKWLISLVAGRVYLDPGSRVNDISTKPSVKHRWQFRCKHSDLGYLYESYEELDVLEY